MTMPSVRSLARGIDRLFPDTSRHALQMACCAMGTMLIGLAATPAQSQCIPQEVAKLIASDAATGDQLGFSVAVSGDTAVVGARNDAHAGGISAGSAYIYVSSGPAGSEVWIQQAKLVASDAVPGAQFGYSVAVSGDIAMVGSPIHTDPGGLINAGAAYVFVRSGGVWTQQAKLAASDAQTSDQFGTTVAVSGDTAVAGAAFGDAPGAPGAGAQYVFVRSAGVWTQQAKLTASDATADDQFGTAVAVSSNTVVVGAYNDDHAGGSDAGSAYVFVRTGTVWTQQTKLIASDTAGGDNFGKSVAVSGDTMVAGAWFDVLAGGSGSPFNGQGSAYVFTRTGGPGSEVWTQQAKLIASDAEGADFFGYSVALSGDTAVVGAVGDDHPGVSNAGSGYVFVRAGALGSEVWTQQAKLIASDAGAVDQFGWSVAVSGDKAVVGTHADDHAGGVDAGAAYVFDLVGCGTPCPADVDGSGGVTGLDLASLLGEWTGATTYAPCPPHKPQDLNQDCKVNGLDLALLLGAWGPCP